MGSLANLRSIMFNGIYVNTGSYYPTSIQNNVIRNIDYYSSSATPWCGIYIQAGLVSVGDITGNIIGSSTSTNSIALNNGNQNAIAYGIYHNSNSNVNISNNTIGSIILNGSSTRAFNFIGIYVSSNATSNNVINNNIIGSSSVSYSIYASSTNTTGNTGQYLFGVYNSAPGYTIISNNTIGNLHNAYKGNNSLGRTSGIYNEITAGSTLIDNNIVTDIYTNTKHSGTKEYACITGITQAGLVAGKTYILSRNKISNIANNTANNEISLYGIYYTSSNNMGNYVSRNFIRNIYSNSSNLAATNVSGIYLYNSNAIIDNNIVLLGSNINITLTIHGIYDLGANTKLYHNTIYLQGSSQSSTYCIYNNIGNIKDYRNNIFVNARSNGTNYAIRLLAILNLTIDYNDYYVSGTGGVLGQINNTNYNSLNNWQTATSQDNNSYNINPQFDNEGGTNPTDYYISSLLSLFGATGTGITVDYTGALRNTTPRIGALERNDFVWVGGTSTDFGTASNWLNNSVPSAGANIIFATTPYNNCLLDQDRIVGNITNTQNTYIMYANGHKLTILGDLLFSNGAQINAKTNSSIIEIAGTEPQNIPVGSFVDNYADGFILNTYYGFTLQENFTIQNDFNLTKGNFSIGANTLTINGVINTTNGTLTGGSNSNIIIGGSSASTTLPAITLNNLTLNRLNGISLGGNLTIENALYLDDGELVIGSNTLTMNGSTLTSNTGSIDASDNQATLIFNNLSVIDFPQTVFSAEVNNLTINGAGLTANSDFTVNGILSLQNSNQSATKGLLDMQDSYILTMGPNATTIGQGDVSGRVKRTSISANIPYTFGSQYTTITFSSAGTLPSEILFIIKIGQTHSIKTNTINRYYQIIRTGGATPNTFSLKLRYLDSELNGNDEAKLVYWDHHVPYSGTSPHEHGKTIYNTNENWIMLAEHGIRYLVTGEYTGEITYVDEIQTPSNQAKIWMLSERETTANYVWLGADDSDWNNNANWSGGQVPNSTSDVFIPDASETPNDPILPTSTEIKSLTIEQGGILYGGYNTELTINGRLEDNYGTPSLSNSGLFIPETSTVTFTNGNAAVAGTIDFYNLIVPVDDTLRIINNSTIRIAGTLTVDGILRTVFDGPTTIEYNGDNQTVIIPNPSTNRYYNLILSGTGTKTMPSSQLNILGDFQIAGTASATAQEEINFIGNVTIDENATFSTGNFNHTILGNFENNGSFNSASGYSILMNGTNETQLIMGTSTTNFNNLEINNAYGVQMYTDINVNEELALNSGNLIVGANTLGINGTISNTQYIDVNSLSSLSFGGTSQFTIPDNLFTSNPSINNIIINRSGGVIVGNQEFTINGTMALENGEFDNSNKTLTIKGNITRTDGTLTTNTSTNLYFEENIDSLAIPDDMFTNEPELNDLKINRSGGVILGNQNITVNDKLILSNGLVNTQNGGIIILTANANVSTDGYNTLPGSINSYINGCMRKIGNTAFIFPIGRNQRYAPIGISDADGGGNIDDFFTACYFDYGPDLDGYAVDTFETTIHHVSQNEYWELNRSGSNNVSVTLWWSSYSGIINNVDSLLVVKWDGDKWVNLGNTYAYGNPSAGTIQSGIVTSFSPFTLGSKSKDNILPIKLLYFTGKANKNNIELKWTTATETNNDYFDIEKSLNVKQWNAIGKVKGAGNSNKLINYSFLDLNPVDGVQYYRLKQVDYDYNYEYSDVISVLFKYNKNYDIIIFPNPTNDIINIKVNSATNEYIDNININIINSLGNLVIHKDGYNNINKIDVSSLEKGVYFIEIKISNNIERV
ncbi:MAG TPA: hypothetical protein P5250_01665, partial [Bacteroidales bacterium]|nr:hypothetical protein [Bacteroidales bacterium]